MANLNQNMENLKIDITTLPAGNGRQSILKLDSSRKSGWKLVKAAFTLFWDGLTDNEGPLSVWLVFNMSLADFIVWIAGDPQGRDAVALKSPAGYAKLLGSSDRTAEGKINDGSPFEITPNWSIPEGMDASIIVINDDASTLTTGCSVFVRAQMFGVWLND